MLEWIIFIVVFFLYIHVIHQYKSSEESDIYEYDYVENTNLQETCSMLQPFIFQSRDILPPPPLISSLEEGNLHVYDDPKKDPIQVPLKIAVELMTTSTSNKYYSEHNHEFLRDTEDFREQVSEADPFLRPSFTVNSEYDLMIGEAGANVPLRYHVHTRRFMVIGGNEGKVSVKMVPWKKNRKHLHEIRDYDRGEYRSAIDVWNPQEHHKRDIKKMDLLEFEIDAGNILYIPPYWGYSIRYQTTGTYMIEYTYSTLFNRIAFIGEIGRTYLQRSNIYHKVHRTLPMIQTDPVTQGTASPLQDFVPMIQSETETVSPISQEMFVAVE